MKYIFILASIMLVMASCTTQYPATYSDDVYYSPKTQPVKQQTMVVRAPESDINSYSQQPQQGGVTHIEDGVVASLSLAQYAHGQAVDGGHL